MKYLQGLQLLALSTLCLFPQMVLGEEPDASAPASNWVDDLWKAEKFSMALRTDYYQNSKTFDGQQNLWGATAQLKALPSFDNLDGKVEMRVINPNTLNNQPTNFVLMEGYVTFHWGQVDVRVGKQNVVWGRADGINPTDNLTPHDYTVQLPFDEDLRFGLNAVKLDYYLNTEMDLTVFTTPFFEPSKFPLPAAGGFSFSQQPPEQVLKNSEVAVKLNKTGGDFDWSMSYFRGYRSLPDMNLASQSASATVLNVQYSQIDVVGGDFARNFDQYAVRGEVAYVHPTGADTSNANQISPYVQAVLGIDRTFDQEMNVNFQVFGRFIQNFNSYSNVTDPTLQQVDMLNAIVNNQQDANNYELSFRVSDKWMNETLGAEVFGVVDLTRSDCYIRPSVNYAFNDQLKGWLGVDIYRGDNATQFGLLKPSDGVFSELRYTF